MYLCRTPSETNVKNDSESTSDVELPSIVRSAENIKVCYYPVRLNIVFYIFKFLV